MYKPNRKKIKQMRLEMGLSQKALSLKSGLPYNAIYRIERGSFSATHPLRAREIAHALGCDVEEIFTPISNKAASLTGLDSEVKKVV